MVDKGHCVSEWRKEFQPEYNQLQWLYWILPPHLPFYIVSVIMSPHIHRGIIFTFNMQCENISKVQLLNNHLNIQLMVIEMLASTKSMQDLN
ncbi:hypothetical protein PAXINDRAFT_86321 [Paxillus involutus ATCC 200175]|uniref:Uncharacterized protein n=1 Tax=Paxillus involutus ATCC 200175 TaxID=664439 RepID=A0A0C9THL6_PAXIN|nr:hypothetical protein PAXINDRAFT_86321 [Paxillus involutus ATCC 200175]